jgi:hypothetical protein
LCNSKPQRYYFKRSFIKMQGKIKKRCSALGWLIGIYLEGF